MGGLAAAAVDQCPGLSERLAGSLQDLRDPGRIEHVLLEMVRQRIYRIACGYPDADPLSRDPMYNGSVGHDSCGTLRLASQPTLCRFENGIRSKDRVRLCCAWVDTVPTRMNARAGQSRGG